MQVEIFSDVVCPWCAIGKRRFESALARFDRADDVELRWRSFELDPGAPVTSDVNSASALAEKYHMTLDKALAAQANLTEVAASEGLEFHFDLLRRGNSFDAHRLLHYAYEVGLQDALKDRLFQAYFSDGDSIGDIDTLARLGEEVGLDRIKVAEILHSDRYAAEVRADELDARQLGIGGVPFFVVDRRFGISGAQGPDAILAVLNEAWANAHPAMTVSGSGESTCEGDNCVI